MGHAHGEGHGGAYLAITGNCSLVYRVMIYWGGCVGSEILDVCAENSRGSLSWNLFLSV